NAVETRIRSNRSKTFSGYRIRIFFDNSQTARTASEAALYRFKVLNPGVSAYRSFSSPYFRVTVGDYRNKSEALAALGAIKQQFPSAFIVQERFKYPAVKNRSAYRVDTLKVLKKVN
ncbi:MAG: SPOR domain-containing protein, partial [Bacteroidales bacterium]|nr:SPOR domain-containing protein [Bacteroidales bacterium]